MYKNYISYIISFLKNDVMGKLTHWDQDKMDAISQTTFSSAFSWMKMFELPIKIAQKVIPKGIINNIPSLVQKMAWRRPGDKPLSEPMMVRLPTDICVTRPQWVKVLNDTKMYAKPICCWRYLTSMANWNDGEGCLLSNAKMPTPLCMCFPPDGS